MPPIPRDIRLLAIVLPSWVGDTVMATPVLRAVRGTLPNAQIVGIMRRGLDDVLRGTPWLDESIVCDMKGPLGPWRLAKAIRHARRSAGPGVHGCVLLPNSFRSALGARLSGAPIRVGYNRDRRRWLLTHAVHAPDARVPTPAVDYYATLTEFALGLNEIDRRIELAVTDDEQHAADHLLHNVKRPFALLNPGANRTDKRWPAEFFAQLADALASSRGLSIVMTGSPAERDILQAVQRGAKTAIINLAERGVMLSSLKAVIQRAAVLITNDTGPRHIAAALGTPVVTLFGPTDHRWTTLCGVRERILLAEPFLPEELVADRHPKSCAIEKISVQDVVAAVDGLLKDCV